MNQPLAGFTVYPKGRWYFYDVFVWKSRKDMHRALRQGCVKAPHCEAICCANKVLQVKQNGRSRVTGQLGQIHFYRGSFTMGIITHEAAHAALYWAKVKKLDPTRKDGTGNASKQEEEFCWVLGNIARQIVLKTDRQWKFPGKEVESIGYA